MLSNYKFIVEVANGNNYPAISLPSSKTIGDLRVAVKQTLRWNSQSNIRLEFLDSRNTFTHLTPEWNTTVLQTVNYFSNKAKNGEAIKLRVRQIAGRRSSRRSKRRSSRRTSRVLKK